MSKPRLNVATIGPVDHGRATLAAALTRVAAYKDSATFVSYRDVANVSRDPDETKTAALAASHIEYATPNRHYSHVDCRGYYHCIRNMIKGAATLDGAILVVSAADGPMPQAREHILLAKQADVPYLVVALTKVDAIDDLALLDMIELEVRELLSACGFPGDELPVVRLSALKALHGEPEGIRGVLNLMDALDACLPLPQPEVDKPFLLPIEDVLSISGRGTVVTGRVERGRVKVGDEIEIVGFGPSKKKVVIGVSMFRTLLESGEAGDNIGLLLRDTERYEMERGQVLCKPGSISPRTRFKGEAYVLPKEEGGRSAPFFSHYGSRFSIGTTHVTGSVTLPEGIAMLMPGDIGTILVDLGTAVALENGMRFTIRERFYTPIAAGSVTDCLQDQSN